MENLNDFEQYLTDKVKDEDQKEVLLTLSGLVDKLSKNAAQKALEEAGIGAEDDMFGAGSPKSKRYAKALTNYRKLWKGNGLVDGSFDEDGQPLRVTYSEMASRDQKWSRDFGSTDVPLLIPRTISQEVKEAIEPNLVLTPLLTRINYSAGPNITFPATGAIYASDIPEGGEYPERSLEFAGSVVATIGKSGVAVKMTEEMIKYSLFDVMSMHLRAAGRALARLKEEKVATMLLANATVAYDNSSTSYLSTTGRNALGAYNGTLTLNDLFRAWANGLNAGFMLDTIIMNPFGWLIFAQEPLARLFGFQNGNLWGKMQGGVGNAPQWASSNKLHRQTIPTDPNVLATTFSNVPSIFPSNFTIIVTPYMTYDSTKNCTDFILCDRNELGVLIVDEDVMTEEFNDPMRDIRKVKFRERYGVASVNNGTGMRLFRNISLDRGFDFAEKLTAAHDLGGAASGYLIGSQPMTGDKGYNAAIVP